MFKQISWRTLPLYFRITVVLAALGILDSVVFIIWRWDKPPNNPGGPLASMGWPVMAWEVSGHFLSVGAIIFSSCAQMYRLSKKPEEDKRIE